MFDAKIRKELTYVAIYLSIVAVFWFFVPAPAPMTDIGVRALGLFFAAIVAWALTEEAWPSLLSFLLAMFTGVFPNITSIIASTWGGETFLFMFGIFMIIAYLQSSGLSNFIAAYLLTRKFLIGHPWRTFAMLLFVGWVISVCAGLMAGMFLTWGLCIKYVT